MAIWRKPLQFIYVMLANRSPMSVAERDPGRMTYAKKKIKPFAGHDLRVTLECAGKNLYLFKPSDQNPMFQARCLTQAVECFSSVRSSLLYPVVSRSKLS